MQRRINYRLLFVALGSLVLFGGAFHGLHLYQTQRNASTLLEAARAALADKKTEPALLLFARYLKLAPKDYDAVEEYASALDDVARTYRERNRVVALLEPLLLKSGDRPQARMRLADNLAAIQRHDAATRHFDLLLPVWRDKAEVQHKRAVSLEAQGKHDLAVKALEAAIDANPAQVKSHVLLAETLHHRLARADDALAALDRMVRANPTSPAARLARFAHFRLLGRDADAAVELAEAQRHGEKEVDVVLAACRWAQSRGDFEKARALVVEGIRQFPENESMVTELANLELRLGDRDKALQVVEAGLKALDKRPQTFELQVRRVDLLIDAGRIDEAREQLRIVRSQGLSIFVVEFLEGRIAAANKNWGDALAALERAKPGMAADPYWNTRLKALVGQCYGQLGDTERQIQAFVEAVQTEPNWAPLNLSLAQALLNAGQPEQALQYIALVERSAKTPPPEYAALKARVLLATTAQTPAAARDWRKVEEALAAARTADPNDVDAVIVEALACLARRQPTAARSALQRAIDAPEAGAKADRLPLWLALVDLELRMRDPEAAFRVLDDAVPRFGDRVELRLARAKAIAQRGAQEDYETLRALTRGLDGFAPEDRCRILREVGETWRRLGNPAAAAEAMQQAADAWPRDPRSRAILVDWALQEQRIDEAKKRVRELATLEGPAGIAAQYADLLIRVDEAARRPEALQKILAGLKTGPLARDPVRMSLLEARIHERLGNVAVMTAKLDEAVKQGHRSPAVLHRLVRLHLDQQQVEKANAALGLAETAGPLSPELVKCAVEAALANKDAARVRELVEPTTLALVRDYRELLWIGDAWNGVGEAKRAEQAYDAAVRSAPHAPEAWVALVRRQVRSGQRSLVPETLERLERSLCPLDRRPAVHARCWEVAGDWAKADEWHEKAMAARPSDLVVALAAAEHFRQTERGPLAEPILLKIVAAARTSGPVDVVGEARRSLAKLWAMAKPDEARRLIEANAPTPADARMLHYLDVLANKNRPAALLALEKSLTTSPATGDERFLLAMAYDVAGNGTRSRAVIEEILADRMESPRMLAFLADQQLRAGAPESAASAIQRLADLEPGTPRTQELERRLAAARK